MVMNFVGRTVLVSGSTRGIGRATAIAYGRAGANVIITGKTAIKHETLPHTIYDTADDVIKSGGNAIALEMDIRDDDMVANAVKLGVEHFKSKGLGTHLDILINNAGAISLTNTENTSMKKFDLMNQINVRGSYLMTKTCLQYLKRSSNPHIVTYCPPLDIDINWFNNFAAYTISKFGMSMCVLGMAEEYRKYGIAVNGLWPRIVIATDAVHRVIDGPSDVVIGQCRKPEIMADATLLITTKSSKDFTGKLLVDQEVLKLEGITNFDHYLMKPEAKILLDDIFIPNINHPLKAPICVTSPTSCESLLTKVDLISEKLHEALNDGLFDICDKSILFRITIDDVNTKLIHIDFLKQELTNRVYDIPNNIIIDVSLDNFVKLFTGALDPVTGYLAGELSITGYRSKGKYLHMMLSIFINKYKF